MYIESAQGFWRPRSSTSKDRHPVTIWRERRRLTMAELAIKIDAPELALEFIERGVVSLPPDAKAAIAVALGVSVSQLSTA